MKLFDSPQVIETKTLALLKKLQADPVLDDFLLVGGTALALQLGHRQSIDLDFFSPESFDATRLTKELVDEYDLKLRIQEKNTVLGTIDGIKIDILRHRGPNIEPPVVAEGTRMASLIDIAAMKLNAISGSGERYKDFIDVYFLLEKMSLQKMLDAYETKYPNSHSLIPHRAVSWFKDIDFEKDPPLMIYPFDLKKMKTRLENAVRNPHQIFVA